MPTKSKSVQQAIEELGDLIAESLGLDETYAVDVSFAVVPAGAPGEEAGDEPEFEDDEEAAEEFPDEEDDEEEADDEEAEEDEDEDEEEAEEEDDADEDEDGEFYTEEELSAMKLTELRTLAKESGVPAAQANKLGKAALVEMLSGDEEF